MNYEEVRFQPTPEQMAEMEVYAQEIRVLQAKMQQQRMLLGAIEETIPAKYYTAMLTTKRDVLLTEGIPVVLKVEFEYFPTYTTVVYAFDTETCKIKGTGFLTVWEHLQQREEITKQEFDAFLEETV